MLHRDCGAYGGSKSFADADVEKAQLMDQLHHAREFVKSEVPELSGRGRGVCRL